MEYNTKDVYFGYPTYEVSKGNFWHTDIEALLKKEDSYMRIKSKKDEKINEYTPGTNEYITVSNIFPIVDVMSSKKGIPEKISGTMINLYLMKYKFQQSKNRKNSFVNTTEAKRK